MLYINGLDAEEAKRSGLGNHLNFGFNGYHAGINIQIPVVSQIFFQPGFLLSHKRIKDEEYLSSLEYRISCLEVPVNFVSARKVYKTLGSKGYFMVGLGPYAGYAIRGKAIIKDISETTKYNIEFKNVIRSDDHLEVYYMRPFDAGGNLFLGYEFAEGIFMRLDIQVGVVNIYPEDKRTTDNKTTIKNSGFGISAGYRF